MSSPAANGQLGATAIRLHISCSNSPTASGTCKKCSTKHHDWVDAPQCTMLTWIFREVKFREYPIASSVSLPNSASSSSPPPMMILFASSHLLLSTPTRDDDTEDPTRHLNTTIWSFVPFVTLIASDSAHENAQENAGCPIGPRSGLGRLWFWVFKSKV